jgi:hypothetical protein
MSDQLTTASKTWEEMAPRERDAAVAREVIGLSHVMHGLDPMDGWATVPEINPIPYDPRMADRGCIEGWYHRTEDGWSHVPHYSTSAAADYAVLKHVRETWGLSAQCDKAWAFQNRLQEMWLARRPGVLAPPYIVACLYEPGDWSRAALAALSPESR